MLAPERQRLVTLMERTVHDQERYGNWTYRAVRPQSIPPAYAGQRVQADCSNGARMLAHWAGVKDDPAGTGYQPYGNSSSIWAHCEHIPLSEAQPGDIATFGFRSGEHHACVLYQYDPSRGWLVWNHGRPGQPYITTLGAEQYGHPGMLATYCQIAVVDPPATPEDKLRAKTGFYSWVAWRLGEGPWRKYGGCDAKVRPAVPTVIPPRWWADYARFLKNRRKPNQASS